MKNVRKQTGKKKDLFTKPDEFQSLTQRAMDYVRDNTTKVMAALGVVAVLFIIAAGVMMWRENARKNLAGQQAEALKYYDINSPVPGGKPMGGVERMQKARELFGKIADDGGPGSDAALYYKANSDMELGDLDKAISGYKEVISRSSGNPALVTLARQRLAEAYLAKGSVNEAVEVYKAEIASDKGLLKDAAHYKLARIYRQTGREQDAANEVNVLKKDFPDSQYAAELSAGAAPAGQPVPIATGVVKPAAAPAKK